MFLKIFLYKFYTNLKLNLFYFKFRIAVVCSGVLWAALRGRKSHWFAFFNLCAVQLVQSVCLGEAGSLDHRPSSEFGTHSLVVQFEA